MRLLTNIGLVAFAALIVVVLLGVADRYVLGFGLVWTEELARYILIWTSLLAAAVTALRQAHFRVELLPDLLGPLYRAAIAVAAAGICLVAAWYGVKFAWMFRGQHSPALGLSMAWIYAAGPIGLVLIAGAAGAEAIRGLKRWREGTANGPANGVEGGMTLLFGAFAGFMIAGIPIALSLLAAGMLVILISSRLSMIVAPQQLLDSLDSFPLLAIPFFLLTGTLMNKGGTTRHLIDIAQALIGHVRGGLAHTAVGAGAMMAGGSGSGTADAAAIGAVMIPEMRREGYPPAQAAAVVAAAGTLAPILPPSIMFILYGHLGNVSVGQLFLAGIVPGLLYALTLIAVSWLIAVRLGLGTGRRRAPLAAVLGAIRRGALDLMLPVIILGGIVGGVFTPTEAGAVAVVYVLAIGTLVHGNLTFRNTVEAMEEALIVLGAVMLIMAAAGIAQFLLALMQAGTMLAALLDAISGNPLVLLIAVQAMLLPLGMVLEVTAVLILMTPILVPVMSSYGVDPVHLGVLIVVNLAIGLMTPPVGLAMFVTCAIARVGVGAFSRAILPYLGALLLLLLALVLFPGISLWLPGLLRG